MAFWVIGAPRTEKKCLREQAGEAAGIEIHTPLPGQNAVPHTEVADLLGAFWARAYT